MSSTFLVAGVKVYVYGLDRIPDSQQTPLSDLAVLYVLHPRGVNFRYSETLIDQWLDMYYDGTPDTRVPLIAVTFDNRNHGERMVDANNNEDWFYDPADPPEMAAVQVDSFQIKNLTHAQDMCSGVDGSAVDAALVIDYLLSVVPVRLTSTSKVRNIVTGVSLGGHITWRVTSMLGPSKIYAAAPIIGSPNLSLMMLQRVYRQVLNEELTLPASVSSPVAVGDAIYDGLTKSHSPHAAVVQKLLPRQLWDVLTKTDFAIERDWSHLIRTFILCGRDDPLVPAQFSELWANYRTTRGLATPSSARLFIQPNTGHMCSDEMIFDLGNWFIDLLSSGSRL